MEAKHYPQLTMYEKERNFFIWSQNEREALETGQISREEA